MSTPPPDPTQRSLAELLALRPIEEQEAFLAGLTDAEAEALAFDWDFLGRPKQQWPPGFWTTWAIIAGRGFGKELDVDEPVPTRDGWKTMGTVEIGDVLFDRHGAECRVTALFPVRTDLDCYRLTFSDGTTIVASGGHRWVTRTATERKRLARGRASVTCEAVRTTDELRATLRASDGSRNHAIDLATPYDPPEADLPLDPYALGVWLGDGSTTEQLIYGVDEAIALKVAEHLPVRELRPDARTGCRTWRFGAGRDLLRAAGVLGDKHVPTAYLRASYRQRLELLRGLMDSDGSVGTNGYCVFAGVNERLVDDVYTLLCSLGVAPRRRSRPAKFVRDGVTCDSGKTTHELWFSPTAQPFHLARKAERVRFDRTQAQRRSRRYLTSVEPVPSRPVRCLTVDSPDHTFVVGRSHLVTHNTQTGAHATRRVAESGDVPMLHLVAPTPADYRDVMIEGPAGILQSSPRATRPEWFPSKRQLVWPNGVKALCFCVTPDTEALTRDRGWVTHERLAAGDVIMTWNTETGQSEWQPVEAVHRFDVVDEPTVDIGGRYHASRTTEAHRWPYLDRAGRARWTTSKALADGRVDSHARLIAAATCADVPTTAKLDDALVELVAWTMTEGSVTRGARSKVLISQSARVNPTHCASIERALRALFGPPRTAQPVGGNARENGVTWRTYRVSGRDDQRVWQLDAAAAAIVLEHLEGAKAPTRDFVLSLTRAQLELFVARCLDGDGHRKTAGCHEFWQNDRARVEAFSLALTLLGVAHGVYERVVSYGGAPYTIWGTSTRRSSTLSLKRGVAANGASGPSRVTRSTFTGTVWCPQTANRTWYARRDGQAFVTGNSAEDPEALRGPQCGFLWADEPGAWTYGEETWDQAQFGLRISPRTRTGPLQGQPRQVFTTTPKPYKWIKKLLADETTHVTRGTTYENLANLAEAFKRSVLKKYEGTSLGRQELMAELIEAVEGALWTPERLELTRAGVVRQDWVRVAVAVDPAVTATADSDETGLSVCAIGQDTELYVLEDATPGRVSPHAWATAALQAYYRHKADVIVAEVNNGGDMVVDTIRNLDPYARVETVTATRGKAVRAEPIAALWEQGRAHLLGTFPELEQQMTQWVPGAKGQDSPDRLDAMVWAATWLTEGRGRARLIA